MDKKRIVRIPPSTLYRELADEAVLLQLDTGEYFGLDEVGNRFWHLIQEVGDFDGIRDRLLSEYNVEPPALSADLERLLGQLVARKLVEIDEVTSV